MAQWVNLFFTFGGSIFNPSLAACFEAEELSHNMFPLLERVTTCLTCMSYLHVFVAEETNYFSQTKLFLIDFFQDSRHFIKHFNLLYLNLI